MAAHGKIDWTAVEADFRAGILSNRQIGKKHGVSESAIRKEAGKRGWVRMKVMPAHQEPKALPPPSAASMRSPDAILPPGDSISLAKDIAYRQLAELDETTSRADELEAAIYEETADDASGRRRALMLKAVSLPSRAMTLKTIVQAMGALKETEGGGGKKAEAMAKAEEASRPGNRFAPPAPPKVVVDNTR